MVNASPIALFILSPIFTVPWREGSQWREKQYLMHAVLPRDCSLLPPADARMVCQDSIKHCCTWTLWIVNGEGKITNLGELYEDVM